ncbi:MAG: TetR/AcrR family transcriptional regulator [Candidatus Gastranaerophilaceae bacterium]
MNKRQLSAQETRKKLVKTALKLFKEKGFYDINVEDITKSANVSKGTFYTYFKRKEDIVLEITRAPFNEINDELCAMDNENIIERLTHYFHRFMECVEFVGIHVCRQWIRDVIDPDNVPDDKDGKKWFYDFEMLKSILNDAIRKNELKENTPTELLSHLLICELYGMMTCWCMSDGCFEPLEWTDKFCKLQLKTILNNYIK